MFTLPNFCRVCLKYDKNLIDLAHIENEPSETLMSKLELCAAEVEWNVFKPLLCHPCIKRLNIAYSFKKQCMQSAGVLKNYIELVKESQKKAENPVKTENIPQGGAYMLLPNQKYVKILVGSQTQGNTFQNVFLNLIPTTTLNSVASENASKNKDNNQNVFLNINNTFQKFIPIAPSDNIKKVEKSTTVNLNVNQLLTETKTEELSVEIDPTDFTGLEDDEEQSSPNDADAVNDWDEVISPTKINSKDIKAEAYLNGDKFQNGNQSENVSKPNIYGNYVPILPKHNINEDFFSSGQHFLSTSFDNSSDLTCETCQKCFSTMKLLKQHIKQFHLGKLPFKCEYCYAEFAVRADYEVCVKGHKEESDALNNSLTLQDFANTSTQSPNVSQTEQNASNSDTGDYACDICHRQFNSSTGLLRHKVRKHNQKNKKKYFIKGMKNAKCDICNREFSTQSYMQLHRKLHLRDDIGYKYKVFGKSKYADGSNEKNEKDENDTFAKKDDKDLAENCEIQEELDDEKNMDEDSDSQEGTATESKSEISESSVKNQDYPSTKESNNESLSVTMEVEDNLSDENHDTDDATSEEN